MTGEELLDTEVDRAMDAERASWKKFKVVSDVKLKSAKQVDALRVNSRWVLRKKPKPGQPCAVKARLVAQEFNKGSYSDSFAATPTTVGQRITLATGLKKKWQIGIVDISTAFLHAELPQKSPVYLVPPATEGYSADMVWVAHKAVYGLRQSPRLFQEHFARRMAHHGRRRSRGDPQLYIHPDGLMSAHTDDLLIVAEKEAFDQIMATLEEEFVVKPAVLIEGSWVRYLGQEYRRVGDVLQVRILPDYYESILNVLGLAEAKTKTVNTPILEGTITAEGVELTAEELKRYRCVVGKLLWLVGERPDVNFAVKELASAVSHAVVDDQRRLKHLARYVRKTLGMILTLSVKLEEVEAILKTVCDASWGS